jgi:hypothetical protein
LGVKSGMRVAVPAGAEPAFLAALRRRAGEVAGASAPGDELDIIFWPVAELIELEALTELEPAIKRNGAIWVVYAKGRPEVRAADVMAAGKAAGLVDVKVVSFSATHTALKFVVPLSRR